MFTYNAVVNRVIDGDTVVLDVDLGFHVWLRAQSFRLVGCNARELEMPGGPEAKANLEQLLPAGSAVLLTSVKADKYGSRFDAAIANAQISDLCTALIATGWAAPWGGKGPKPVPPWPIPTAS